MATHVEEHLVPSLRAHADVLDFGDIALSDLGYVGGKNSSLGELFRALKPKGVGVVDGFATTARAYRRLLAERGLEERLRTIFSGVDVENLNELASCGEAARAAVLETPLPAELRTEIFAAYDRLAIRVGREAELAVRSSATAEDLPEASFAGAAETFLNVRGREGLLRAVHACCSSLFTDRAISYRARLGYDQLKVALSVGVMPMVRADKASSGVIFTLDTESGFRDVVTVSGAYGLGEFVVQGVVTPDEWTVFKPTLATGHAAVIGRRLGTKEVRLVYADGSKGTRSEPTPPEERSRFCLEDDEVLTLARWACEVESHYSTLAGHARPMDLEWAKDGITGELFIIQARPETVHSARPRTAAAELYRLVDKPGRPIVTGQAVGERIGAGRARVVRDVSALGSVQAGDVLVAPMTDPDWEPVMRRVAAIVTDRGGRTAHAAIVSREFGLPCIVGAEHATLMLHDGDEVTVSCAEGADGHVYPGRLHFEVERIDAAQVAETKTKIMLIVGDPSRAFAHAAIPNAGVGLARIEFIITNHIGIHPMAIARYPRLSDAQAVKEMARRIGDEQASDFFVRRLSEGVARIAAAFYPKPVIVRMSDFKTNEYAQLLGGREFEPKEENPMLGVRGASRYDDPRYADGFALECAALLRVRRDLGLTNVKLMIPFCRTVDEGRRVIRAMADRGLRQGPAGVEIYAMCEVPSNVVLADQFLEIFDGYSIGSNDLTQLTLGIDRDSGTVAKLFDERNDAMKWMLARAIAAAKRAGKPIGICGQAPSDYPELAEWLVREGIDSISLNPDVAIATALRVAAVEARASS
ncbi:MAG TPA: phosphoenolpyruvate synthase [Vicinamibacterales bacterium]|nr:phosphoenolpyruvate synthase [Vicinamibacterales bacterium]